MKPLLSRLAPAIALAAAAWVATPDAAGAQAAAPRKGPRGDVTLDGAVSAADAQAILFSVVGLSLPPGYAPMPWGDVNGDGRLTALDAQIVLAYVVGLPTTSFAVGAEMSRVTSVTVTPGATAMLAGATAQVTAVVTDSAGSTLTDRPVAFFSSDTTVATVSATGLISARRDGYVTVSAMSEGVLSSVFVGVGPINGAACGVAGTSGTPHGGTVNASQTWTRAASPHFVGGDLVVDAGAVLTIEPGAGVCVAPNVQLSFVNGGRLSALGTAAMPISFSASDTTQFWRGFSFDGAPSAASTLHGVVISQAGARQATGANGAIISRGAHIISLDSARIRQTDTRALDIGVAGSTVQRTTIDTTRIQPDSALFSSIFTRAATTLDSVYVRDVGGFGVSALTGTLTLRDVTVDGAFGPGLSAEMSTIASATRVLVKRTRFPFQGAVDALATIAPTSVEQALLLGNRVDSALVLGGRLRGRTLSLTRALPVQVLRGFPIDSGGVLVMRDGASLAFGDTIGISVNAGGRLDARGTATDSITFTAIDTTKNWGPIIFSNQGPADTSVVRYAKVSFGGVRLATPNARGTVDPAFEADYGYVTIDSSSFRKYAGLAVVVTGPGSVLRKVAIDSGIASGIAAAYAGYGALVEDVSVTRASDAGIWLVTGPGAADGITLRGTISVDGTSVPGRAALELRGTTSAYVNNSATITVRNAKGYALAVGAAMFTAIAKDSVAQARFLGNGNLVDTILVGAGSVKRDTITAYAHMGWRVNAGFTVDSGAVFAMRPGARIAVDSSRYVNLLRGGRLVARGTATAPIRVTNNTSRPNAQWGGFNFSDSPSDSSYLTNAIIDGSQGYATILGQSFNSLTNTYNTSTHPVIVDSVRVRNSKHRGVFLASAGSRVSRTVVDTTLSQLDATNTGTNGITVNGSNIVVEDDTVRASAGGGIMVTGNVTGVRLLRGEVTGGGLTGLFINACCSRNVFAQFVAPRVTGAYRGLQAPVNLLSVVARDSAMVSNYVGNIRDTIAVGASPDVIRDTIQLSGVLPYRVAGSMYIDTGSVLDVRPGARIAFPDSQGVTVRNGARLVARGTPARPITFSSLTPTSFWTGITLSGVTGTDSSYMTNVLVERGGRLGAAISGGANMPLILDSIRVRQSFLNGVSISTPGSRISRSYIDTTYGATTTNFGISASGNVIVEADTIRGVAGVGLYTLNAGVHVYGGYIAGSGQWGLFPNNVLRTAIADDFIAPRITGGASYPIGAAISGLRVIARDSAMLAMYAGNAKDSVDVFSTYAVLDTIALNPGMPYRIRGSIAVDTNAVLLIRPGTVIAAADGASISARGGGRIIARGTAARPIVVTPFVPGTYWGAINVSNVPLTDSSYVTNALLEYGGKFGNAINAQPGHPIILDSIRVRQSLQNGLILSSDGSRLSRSVIDTTGTVTGYAVQATAAVKIEGDTIRASRGAGLILGGAGAQVLGGAILNSAGTGLQINNQLKTALAAYVAPVITGGASYPITTSFAQLKLVAADTAMAGRYAGNAKDSIDVGGAVVYRDTIPFNGALPYRVRNGLTADTSSLIAVGAGSRLAIANDQYIIARNGAHVLMLGTSVAPVRLTALTPGGYWGGLSFESVPLDTSYITNALVEYAGSGYAAVGNQDTHPVVVSNSRIRQSKLRALNLGSWSRVQGSIVDTTGAGVPAVTFYGSNGLLYNSIVRGADSIGVQLFGSGNTLQQSEITGSGYDLLAIAGGASTHSFSSLNLTGYNLKGAGGVAVRNTDTVNTATLYGTWWGSTAGKPAGSTAGLVTNSSDNTNSANPVTPSTP